MANLINSTTTITMAEYNPNFPISSAICYNFICNGVAQFSYWANKARILPIHEQSPTTVIKSFPYPVKTLVPPIKIGDGT
jgi:hypothetical protein